MMIDVLGVCLCIQIVVSANKNRLTIHKRDKMFKLCPKCGRRLYCKTCSNCGHIDVIEG